MRRKSTAEAIASAARDRTGCLTVTDRQTGVSGRVFLVRGEPYSVALEGYRPDVIARLRAAGALTPGQLEAIEGDPFGARRAVEQGWISVDVLADVHTELLVAGLGALLARDRVTVEITEGPTTDALCAVPAPLKDLIELAERRRERTAATWGAVGTTGTPFDTGLAVDVPAGNGDAPELAAFLSQCAQGLSIDMGASRIGLTRAEAVHLAALAVLQHRAQAVPVGVGPQRALSVPEQFGQVRPDPTAPEWPHDDAQVLRERIARLEGELDLARAQLAALASPTARAT